VGAPVPSASPGTSPTTNPAGRSATIGAAMATGTRRRGGGCGSAGSTEGAGSADDGPQPKVTRPAARRTAPPVTAETATKTGPHRQKPPRERRQGRRTRRRPREADRRADKRADADDALIVYVSDNYGDWNASRDDLVWRALHGEHPELVEPLQPQHDYPFLWKPRHSAFYETSLGYLLTSHDIERVGLTGQVTEQGILYGTLEAYIRTLDVVVPEDAVVPIHPNWPTRPWRWCAATCAPRLRPPTTSSCTPLRPANPKHSRASARSARVLRCRALLRGPRGTPARQLGIGASGDDAWV